VFWVQVVIAGLATGAIYSLAGMGLVLTYKATGVFNFAHGAIAMIVAYAMWQARNRWGWSLWASALLALFVVGPGIGVLLERLVFRPLNRKLASQAERLVATVGTFILCLGVAYFVWTGKVRVAPHLVSTRPRHLFSTVRLGTDQGFGVLLVIVVSAGLWALFRYTAIGVEIRAVVDRRELSELAAINANRVASLAWAMGCGLAGLTGVLLAPAVGLDPIHLTLFVVETFSVAVVAGLTSLPMAVAAGILILGVGGNLFDQWNPHGIPFTGAHLPSALVTSINLAKPYLSVIVLFIALIVRRRLDEPSDALTGRTGLISVSIGRTGRRSLWSVAAVLAALGVAAAFPVMVGSITLLRGQETMALVVIFASVVAITGWCGYITLGQGAFAGFGAFMSAKAAGQWHLPVLLAMVVGGVAGMLLGLVAGAPALRRRGLFLGLTTLGVGLIVYDVIFNNRILTQGGLAANRPSWFAGERAFYWFELGVVVLVLAFVANLRHGRLGRILASMRDSEVAAQSVGVDLRAYKLLIFAVSAFLAGIGGALLSQRSQLFSADDFHPLLSSILWFAVVIVAGADSVAGAVVGAVAFKLLDAVLPTFGAATAIIALLAIVRGWVPGGSIVGAARRLRAAVGAAATAREATLVPGPPLVPSAAPTADGGDGGRYVPSEFAERVLASRARPA